ncbi:NAD-glutamate dehydrogenase [Rothia nasisuis]|uniref:NAD-glutamate dehydrogenase n=1 Tax=Rothia nasisuis TaxID=2109647 RepID=UPI001F1A876F|nr:NAD-glutamate dehydrogenase [Rothia nasisuis]
MLTNERSAHWSEQEDWINEYYRHSSAEELEGLNDQQLTDLAQTHRSLAYTREAGAATVRVLHDDSGSTLFIVVDDTSFLVSSVTAQIASNWGGISGLIHPIFLVERDGSGQLTSVESTGFKQPVASGDTVSMPIIRDSASAGSVRAGAIIESWIAVRLAARLDDEQAARLEDEIRTILVDVRLAARDTEAMACRALDIAENLGDLADITLGGAEHYTGTINSDADPMTRVESVQEFLRWLTRGNFLFMGVKERDLTGRSGDLLLTDRPGSGLGILAETVGGDPIVLTGLGLTNARDPKPLYITKANSRSTVHRHEYLDYIGVRNFDRSGKVVGEYVILGLFSRQAYSLPAVETPLVRERVAIMRRNLGYQPGSHSDKTLAGIIEDYPRLELLHADLQELTDTFRGIMGLEERRTTRLFLRPDAFGRFVSATVFLPRDRYNTQVRHRLEAAFREFIDIESLDFEVYLSTSSLARIFFRLSLSTPNTIPDLDARAIERRLQQATRSWGEATAAAVESSAVSAGRSAAQGREAASAWAEAVPATYRADYEVDNAVEDIDIFESLSETRPAAIHIYEGASGTRIKTYLATAHTLTELLPVMQNMGLVVVDQKPYEITPADGRSFSLYDFGVQLPEGVQAEKVAHLYEDALNAYLLGRRESDTLDRLILAEGLTWEQVRVFRAYTHYLVQLGQVYTAEFMSDTLLAYPAATRLLADYFSTSFDPDADFASEQAREDAREQVWVQLGGVLDAIPTLDVDRFMRSLATVMKATLRTNAYLQGPALALKVAPGQIDFAPLPRPTFEIFVYSPRVEGVHLRFGSVARGGLRWSDRREDYRTEVLGLVKAQMVKNAVIIPTGAKGGFYPKQLPNPAVDRDAWIAEGRESYRVFISSLLDVTDNLNIESDGSETVIHDPRVIARDGDDYYLVVAADKGTASFSDTANAISADYGFWLGDAFASGGSVGYDHKAMGITARGAWESVKRHFAELGIDCQTQEFTAVGIGDMSGDVFGNGLMRSPATRLVAAFDHRDIFLDPAPNPEVAFEERVRLYNLPRSSWQDYNPELISEGGGVFSRGAKSIPVSEQVREVLGIEEGVTEMAPPELLSAILKAPVDLLYNGGIGTYVKGFTETHAAVGDKANDSLRVNGRDLRARVVGEGGNLGFTQLGRIEAARAGILINTDAIDNSAGVETSDREVNIKILVDRLVTAGELPASERAGFIEAQREDVGAQVLLTNVEQNVLLQAERHGVIPGVEAYIRLIHDLEERAGLNREVEFLPTDEEIRERYEAAGETLNGPELAVLAAYVKIHLAGQLEQTDIADDPYLVRVLTDYFPPALVERFGQHLESHPLRRQIICTRVANEMVNLGGITHVFRAVEETGAGVDALARAFYVSRETFGIGNSARLHRELPATVPLEGWQAVIKDWQRVLDRLARWFVAERSVVVGITIDQMIERFKPVAELIPSLKDYFSEDTRARVRAMRDQAEEWGLPEELIVNWIREFEAFALMDVVRTAEANGLATEQVARVYYSVYDRFQIDMLLTKISTLPRNDRWETLARSSLRDDLYEIAASLALGVVQEAGEGVAAGTETGDAAVARWVNDHPVRMNRVDSMLGEIQKAAPGADGRPRLAVLQVALRTLRSAL